jgi:hypothetical protein
VELIEDENLFEEYQSYQGQQSYCQVVGSVISTRLLWFRRSKIQWTVLFMPLIYVIINLLITASMLSIMVESRMQWANEVIE